MVVYLFKFESKIAMWGVFVQKCTARSSSVRFNPTMYGFTPLCINAYIQLFFSYATSTHTQKKKKKNSTQGVMWKEHMQHGGMENTAIKKLNPFTAIKKIKPLHCNKKNIKPFHCSKKIKPLHCNKKTLNPFHCNKIKKHQTPSLQ